MEIRIGKEKRHLEVGGAASGGRRGTCSRAEQLTIVGEGFYGLPAGLGLFCSLSSFIFSFPFLSLNHTAALNFFNNHMASPCHALCSPRRRLGDLNECLAMARLAALKTMLTSL